MGFWTNAKKGAKTILGMLQKGMSWSEALMLAKGVLLSCKSNSSQFKNDNSDYLEVSEVLANEHNGNTLAFCPTFE